MTDNTEAPLLPLPLPDIKVLAKRAKLPKYMYDTEGGCDALSRLVAIALGDSVVPPVQPETVDLPTSHAPVLMKLIRAAWKGDRAIAEAYGGLLADRLDADGRTGKYVRWMLETLRGERDEVLIHPARRSCIVACGQCGARHESSDEYERSGTSWNERATPAQAAPEAVALPSPQARALLDIAQYLAGHLQMVQDRIDAALATPSAVPSPSAAEDAMDAKRYRWLLSFGNALYVEWRHDCAHGPTALNAAIDAALSTGPQKAKGPGAHTEASEAGQEPPTHAGSVAPGEGL
jgi:hypothetical protein